MVHEYKKGADVQLSTHFHLREFDCHCTREDCDITLVDSDLIEELEIVRGHLGALGIMSGYRCQKHNRAEGGKKGSYHLLGKAADVQPKEVKASFCADVAERVSARFRHGGIGRAETFTHLDVRGYKARWVYP